MSTLKTLRAIVFATAAGAALTAFAAPAFAGECPAASVGVDVREPGPSTPSNVTDKVISSVDLNSYNIQGRQLRLRRLVVQPGGVVAWHSHAERPANIYVVSGQISEYRSTCRVPIVHRTGEVVAESGNVSHWWKNTSGRVAVLLSSDILPPQMSPDQSM